MLGWTGCAVIMAGIVVAATEDKREGRILVDVARNTYGQTIVAPFSVRRP